MQFSNIINASLIYATFRASTPIIYAALCAAITQQANILNIGTEGIMLVGAFTAVTVSYLTGSWVLAILISMLAGMAIALIMAVGHIKYQAEICAIGMGINMFAIAITKYLLNSILGKSGSFSDPKIVGIPKVPYPVPGQCAGAGGYLQQLGDHRMVCHHLGDCHYVHFLQDRVGAEAPGRGKV